MGYLDKMRQREAKRKLAEEIMNTREFKEAQKQQEEQAVLNALARFSFIACSFLETRHYYKGNGLKTFLKHVLSHMEYTEENELYFKEYYEYVKDEYNLDILAELGLGLEESE